MKTDKQLKADFKKEASKSPEKYYATSVLKEEGFSRNKCSSCKLYFWSTDPKRKVCGDGSCSEGFRVVANNPIKRKLSYEDVWNTFQAHFKKRGYTPIERYPVVARWNPTVDFTIASIAAFQPFVVSGEVDPPAQKLTIPQFCLRFVDIDNIGITGSHCTGFVMIGQHQFVAKEKWDLNQAFRDVYSYLIDVVGLPKEELTLHEDVWAGGGNFGPCMEFFARGVELFNQVYMMFEQTASGATQELSKKVLDMGLGMERIAWFTQGTPNLYEAVFPKTLAKIRKQINIEYDLELFKRFSNYGGMLNVDEVEDIDKEWEKVAQKLGEKSGSSLKEKIMPMTSIYSIAEHSRALLVALNDGMLPSNVGGGYNLRVILRRALSFIDHFNWNLDLREVAKWHAQELKSLFPELLKNFEDTKRILEVEIHKYETTRSKAQEIVTKIITKKITTDVLIDLYDNQGILPQLIKDAAKELGKKVVIPDNFFLLVSERQEERSRKEKKTIHKEEIVSDTILTKLPETKIKYYTDWKKVSFKAKVIYVKDRNIILDGTYFYPTSGGQAHDEGTISGQRIAKLVRSGKHIIHVLEEKASCKVGDTVECVIDMDRRKQLTQHHTSAHILNAAARQVLGNHINQAGATKKRDRAHLDVTHFSSLTEEELRRIETEANKIVTQSIKVNSIFVERTKAEQKYGVRIYQGGVAPGKILRIVEIPGVEVEACGGTHLRNTSEAEKIVITSSTKISDGVVRINYVAGLAAFARENAEKTIVEKSAKLLSCSSHDVPAKAAALFSVWKKARKAAKKGEKVDANVTFAPVAKDQKLSSRELLEKTAEIFATQPEHVPKTITRFLKDIKKFARK